MNLTQNSKLETQISKKPAVFLDRDGTLIEEVNFLSRVEDLRLFPFTNEALELLKKSGFLLIVVTNQSGINREIFAETEMHKIHAAMQACLGGKIDAFYFCPHLPGENCRCRKPQTEMFEKACKDFAIDLENSWTIGDKKIDVEAGFNAGTKTALVLTGYGGETIGNLETKPDFVAENLLEAGRFIAGFQRAE